MPQLLTGGFFKKQNSYDSFPFSPSQCVSDEFSTVHFDADADAAAVVCCSTCSTHLGPTLGATLSDLDCVCAVLRCCAAPLCGFLSAAYGELRFLFALPWLLTWFAHSSANINVAARLFDFFFAVGDKFSPIYFAAALIIHNQEKLLSV